MRIGPQEFIIVLIIVLVIFGPKNLPKLGKMFGKTMKNFKEGMEDVDENGDAKPAETKTVEKAEKKDEEYFVAPNVTRKKKAEVMSDDGSMTLTGHLKELRNRLIICAAVFVVGVIGFLAISDKLIDLLTAMAMNANYTFVFLAPQEKLMQYFRVSLIAAVIVTIPVALYQVYAFAKPGLKRSESFFFRLVLLFGLALFCVGVLFAYKVTLPFMLNFLVTLEGTDYITASISIESYINLCLTMFIIFGCVFEMPLVTIILAKMGIANPEIMKKGRGVAIVLIFLVAAIITPPDIVSQCFVAVPMCLLYFISIFLSGIFYKPKTDDDDEDEDDEEESSDEE